MNIKKMLFDFRRKASLIIHYSSFIIHYSSQNHLVVFQNHFVVLYKGPYAAQAL